MSKKRKYSWYVVACMTDESKEFQGNYKEAFSYFMKCKDISTLYGVRESGVFSVILNRIPINGTLKITYDKD